MYKTTLCLKKMDHSTDGDNLVIHAVDLHPRTDKDDTITARQNVHLEPNLPQIWTLTFHR